MEMTFTSRDKQLLSILACALILVGIVWYMIVPMYKRSEELDMEIEEAQLTKQEMQMQIQMYPISQQSYAELQGKAADATKEYYDLMTPQDIDKELTNIVLSQGLECINLNIERMTLTETEPYVRSELARAQQIDSLLQSADSSAQETTGTGTQSQAAQAEAYASAGTSDTSSAVENPGVQDQIYSYKAHVTVEGKENDYQKLVDLLTDSYPAIRVTGISYQQSQTKMVVRRDGSVVEGKTVKQMTLDLELYMCNKALYAQTEASGQSGVADALNNVLQMLMEAGS